MTSNPFISIITATYNSEATLQKTIDSVKAQKFKDFEFIIVDGGSKDKTVDIIKKNEGVVTNWISEKDRGIYDAWNKGLAMARGSWISFVGSDDYFKEDALEQYAACINAFDTGQLLYVSSKIELINDQQKVVRIYGWPWKWEKFRRFNTVAHPGSMHSKKLFEKYGQFDPEFKICGDYEMLLRPREQLHYHFLNKITLTMYNGGASSNPSMYKEHLKAVLKHSEINKQVAYRDFIYQLFKLYLKNKLQKLGLNIKIKKEHI